jgi:HEAT repeat protein
LPILKQLLADRTKSNPELRARALFIIAQHDDPEVPALLVRSVREDPDPEVRQTAVFWLGQVDSPEALTALKEVLADPKTEAELREQALFAVSQQESDEALAVLRQVARDPKVDVESRGRAIFWIGQRGGKQSATPLRDLYGQLEDDEVKEQVLFAASQSGEEMQGWLLEVARNPKETMELRCRAIFWAGQLGDVPAADIYSLYQTSADRELKEQVIFTLSQQGGDDAVDKLMQIVRQEQDPELRTMAVFWIGQSNHPRAAAFLEEIINK